MLIYIVNRIIDITVVQVGKMILVTNINPAFHQIFHIIVETDMFVYIVANIVVSMIVNMNVDII